MTTRWYIEWKNVDGGSFLEHQPNEVEARRRWEFLRDTWERGFNTSVRLITETRTTIEEGPNW